jgi:cell division inhibitor SulA
MNMEQKIIQREHSYIADDKTLCIYIADNETLLKEHSQRSGFPITKILEVLRIIDPVTAESSKTA